MGGHNCSSRVGRDGERSQCGGASCWAAQRPAGPAGPAGGCEPAPAPEPAADEGPAGEAWPPMSATICPGGALWTEPATAAPAEAAALAAGGPAEAEGEGGEVAPPEGGPPPPLAAAQPHTARTWPASTYAARPGSALPSLQGVSGGWEVAGSGVLAVGPDYAAQLPPSTLSAAPYSAYPHSGGTAYSRLLKSLRSSFPLHHCTLAAEQCEPACAPLGCTRAHQRQARVCCQSAGDSAASASQQEPAAGAARR